MLINIDEVQVSDRIRKDFGNIEELAQDIKENGLINPPVVTPEFELIAGERRLRAMKHLGFNQVEVLIMKIRDAEHALNLEISENETRKDFSKLERLDYARKLERIESVKAKERQGTRSDILQNFAECKEGTTRDLVAEKIGIGSGETYRKEKFIADNADPELLKKWDEGDITTHKAYIELKERIAEKDAEIQRLKQDNVNFNTRIGHERESKEFLQSQLNKTELELKQAKKQKPETIVKKEIIYEESPELQEALFNAQQKANELNERLAEAEEELGKLQYIKEKGVEKYELEAKINKLKSDLTETTKDTKNIQLILNFIDKTNEFIKQELLHIPTLIMPLNLAEDHKNRLRHICSVIDNFQFAIKEHFKL